MRLKKNEKCDPCGYAGAGLGYASRPIPVLSCFVGGALSNDPRTRNEGPCSAGGNMSTSTSDSHSYRDR